MPTYQYTCTSCAEPLEVVQKFSDDPLTECPKCAGRLRKVFSPVGIVFKGSGFYRNDSRSAGSSTSAASANGEAKKDGDGNKDGEGKKDGTAKKDTAAAGSNGSSAKSESKAPAASTASSSS